ncbi:phosphomevalonate kinase [Rhinocladiella mackenziei CBS 650.93]|uniref:Phosphomevalonate kinase n=1 Tax=Rhinocladiella mackenziei CBS 650.93 TaxID=1442369 RepID=A0A0D2H1E1_9EURO|nr:phosphomevalonate kinase [Rhinocladiella mackenziei CBS 650.93]KIX04273.1 phosphomevalonate kinase [Rhinocladiella mackenziei CBS 650.93]
MSLPAVAVSAPGKVLFAGGFLVLDRQHTGLVFGLNARIHVHVEALDKNVPATLKRPCSHILVQSPQFLDAKWLYAISTTVGGDEHAVVTVEQVLGQEGFTRSSNKFVETTLRYVLTYLSHLAGDVWMSAVKVSILADDDYYSQPQPISGEWGSRSQERPQSQSEFTSFGVKLSDAHKTGLGSSAALVTALVSALLVFYARKTGVESPLHHTTIHNLAQAAHCAAQGKVGSGFDVAAAVYGSCLYRRFTPTILEAVGDATSVGFSERLHRCVDDLELERKWDVEVASQAVRIPESLLLIMCDVDCGSETPGMVRKVLQWRKEKQQTANLLWNTLQQRTDELCTELCRLAEIEGTAKEDDDGFRRLGDIILTIRSLVREMSSESGVPIEPPVITELLDFCTSLPGVVGGVAPGAGGYDAVALLVKNDGEVVRELQSRLEGWKSKDQTDGGGIGHVRLLGVKQEKQGVKMEDVSKYDGWS